MATSASTPYSYDLSNEEDVKHYLKNIEIEYSFHCFSEKNPDGCYRLASFYDTIKIDKKKAMKLYQTNCDDNEHGDSCNKLAKHMMLKGKLGGGIKDGKTEDIFKYHDKACQYGNNESCYSSALMQMDPEYVGENTNLKKCLEYFNKACDRNDGRSCSKLGEIYRKGSHVQKDMTKALEYHKKGCDLEMPQSCVNLSYMYRKGDGIPKNDDLAEKYRDIVKKLAEKDKASTMKMSQ
ncbi:cytochrome c oxidase assembly factor 7B-like isoform X1 [Mytilus trossulus]|uniref:cytochrome c oxidase assembly factor 7B-like isoform X1 n=1 Tax=Mytilus trossulus TaxID=6551 RepID=UPI003004E4B5